ncbi:MAG TPA: cytochrome c biogenesis protein CcdA [Methanotrichaceae archaeon]|nr:cytochrome c biogenesis protein CcdA [Methanotrichaceae archaeon]
MLSLKSRPLIIGLASILVIAASLFMYSSVLGTTQQSAQAPDFKAVDVDGKTLSLSDFKGQMVVLHITNIETPLCRECEPSLKGQVKELERLRAQDPSLNIVTLNMRKNPYSKNGRSLIESWGWGEISWPWIEDFEPYPTAGKYIDYSTLKGGFSNPSLLLIDRRGKIAGLYHVYQLGKGEIDGVQSAEALIARMKSIDSGEKGLLEIGASGQSASYLGMFVLGIITSLSPCSIALLIAMISYIMATRRKEEYLRKTASASGEGLMIGIAFTLGMAMVFFVMGLFLSDMGVFVRDARSFDLAAGLIMIVLGINYFKPMGEVLEPAYSRIFRRRNGAEVSGEETSGVNENVASKKIASKNVASKSLMERVVYFSLGLFKYSSFIGAFSLGVFFALGWAPCAVSLVFPVLIWLISQDISPLAGGLMLFAFGAGHGVPVIPISTFSRAIGGRIGERYISAGRWITGAFGVSIILVGLVYAARYFGYAYW